MKTSPPILGMLELASPDSQDLIVRFSGIFATWLLNIAVIKKNKLYKLEINYIKSKDNKYSKFISPIILLALLSSMPLQRLTSTRSVCWWHDVVGAVVVPCPAPHWWLKISCDRCVCNTEMGKCYKSGCDLMFLDCLDLGT